MTPERLKELSSGCFIEFESKFSEDQGRVKIGIDSNGAYKIMTPNGSILLYSPKMASSIYNRM